MHARIPTPAALAPATPYDRRTWERALLGSEVRRDMRLIGLVLAAHADPAGHLPTDGPQRLESLCALARIDGKRVRACLRELELAGYLRRPNLHTWRLREAARPIQLTLPAAAATRTEPAHTGEVIR